MKTHDVKKENLMKKQDGLAGLLPMGSMADPGVLRAHERARYQRYARLAASFERAGQYAEAAQVWGEAYKSARGPNADWCQSRLSLCENYAGAQALTAPDNTP
ncbi:UNVERIFIED_ORG: hypothetical protein M2414_005422 [Rahnella aquatilis]